LEDLLRPFTLIRHLSTGDIIVNVLDIFLVTFLIYRLLMLVRGTRAWRIILGVLGFLIVLYVSKGLHLYTLHWLLEKATFFGPVALVVLLLPELRTALEGFGMPATLLPRIVTAGNAEDRAEAKTVEEIVAAIAELSSGRVGALIVIERQSPLFEIAANGVSLQAKVSAPLLGAIFYDQNPLHDGAVVIHGDTIISAACRLPLSESSRLDQTLHMRHRAGVGVTEAFDCLAVIVSEERGTISVASDGRLTRLNSHLDLRNYLNRELRHMEDTPESGDAKPKRLKKKSPGEAKG
jgi:diadenylate cyclase